MTWTKLSDDFSDDCWELSDAAIRLHMEGLVWSNRKLLDCRLVKDDMVRWAKRPGAAEELVNAGWWRDEGDYYVIVHHARYQRTREVMLKLQERNQRNGASGGRPPKVARERFSPEEPQAETQVGCQVETQRDGTGRDGPGKEGDQLFKRDNEKDDVDAADYVADLRDWHETESLTESLTETESDGDRTGQARSSTENPDLKSESSESESVSATAWPDWHGQGPSPFEEYR